MVWRNNKTTGKRGRTGPGVVIAISPAKTSFWIHMRDSLLKCSGEQVRKATDSECLELAKVLSQELMKSRERSGQRGFVDIEAVGKPEQEPPEDTRPNVGDVMGVDPEPGEIPREVQPIHQGWLAVLVELNGCRRYRRNGPRGQEYHRRKTQHEVTLNQGLEHNQK